MDPYLALWGAIFGAIIATISFVVATSPKRTAGSDSPEFYGIIEGGANRNTMWFFALSFLFLWSLSVWIPAVGPMMMGIPWFLFFFLGVLFSLLFATVVSPEARLRGRRVTSKHPSIVKWPNIYLWGVMGLLLAALVIGILN